MKSMILASLLLAACSPSLVAQSAAPPGRTARLDPIDGFWGTKAYRAEVSVGVALAITCDRGGPCERMTITSSDPAIAEVRPASFARLDPLYSSQRGQASAAAFVVVGKAPGKTQVHLTSKQGTRTVYVTIVPPPPTPTPGDATPRAI